jgi:ribose 5-phosphate isomerase B
MERTKKMKKNQKSDTKTILIAADHAGFELKKKLVDFLRTQGRTVEDMGADGLVPDDDYPAIMAPLGMRIATDPEKYAGIVIGGSGTGEAIVCNRFPGVRAAVYYGGGYDDEHSKSSLDIVRLSREHNDANVLSLGARFVTDEEAIAAARLFFETPFSEAERHARRIAEIDEIE